MVAFVDPLLLQIWVVASAVSRSIRDRAVDRHGVGRWDGHGEVRMTSGMGKVARVESAFYGMRMLVMDMVVTDRGVLLWGNNVGFWGFHDRREVDLMRGEEGLMVLGKGVMGFY